MLGALLDVLASPGLMLAGQAEVLSTMTDQLQMLVGGCPLSFVRRVHEPAPSTAVPTRPAASSNPQRSVLAADLPQAQARPSSTP